ncbi:FMN-dependent NADH-azoreductase [Pseudomonas sp. NPDC090202]|uniref:FMN-dependent NADH-azoreductase n=1 Tax=unclassified Pseudomonas TaxID=196821 RepID=UPI003815F163
MKNLLMLNCSPQGARSSGYRLAVDMLESARQSCPDAVVSVRDLVAEPLLPISADYSDAILQGQPDDAPAFAQSERLIAELERADLLLIVTPIHNFTLPAVLKLWIDNIVRAGRTFSHGPKGKVGLLEDRPVYILVSSGGVHSGPQARQPEFLTPYLRHLFGSIGLFDLHFVYLQGTVMGPEVVADAVAQARRQLAFEPLFTSLAPQDA